jgi:hypothetical protein
MATRIRKSTVAAPIVPPVAPQQPTEVVPFSVLILGRAAADAKEFSEVAIGAVEGLARKFVNVIRECVVEGEPQSALAYVNKFVESATSYGKSLSGFTQSHAKRVANAVAQNYTIPAVGEVGKEGYVAEQPVATWLWSSDRLLTLQALCPKIGHGRNPKAETPAEPTPAAEPKVEPKAEPKSAPLTPEMVIDFISNKVGLRFLPAITLALGQRSYSLTANAEERAQVQAFLALVDKMAERAAKLKA